MITPEYLSYMLDTLEVQKQLEQSILDDIVRRIVKTDFTITDTAEWQTEKLQQCGVLYSDIIKEISKKTGKTEAEICAIYEDAGAEVFNYAPDSADIADIVKSASKPMSKAMKNMWKASLKKTVTEAINLTKTTAVTSQTAYITACDLAYMQVASGAFTYQEAIKRAISSAINQGVNVVYPSGHISSLDTAIRRSVLTGVNQTAGQLQDMRAEEIECDLMEITAHAGARPDHAEWQGRIVSLSGRRDYLSLDDIGYGRVDGFMGANCRHNWHMYFEGISKPAYSKEMLTEYNGNTVQYNGKTLTGYEASQKQRTLERAVKKQKQKLVCTETAIKNTDDDILKAELKADFDRQAVKLKERESKLDDFCKQTGRKIDSHRVQVYGFDRSVSSKAVWGNKRVANSSNGAIMEVRSDSVAEISKLGKIKTQPIEKEFGKLRTDEIIITNERIDHIKFRHPQDYELFEKYGVDTIEDPDVIIKDEKNEGTVFMVKHLDETNLNVVVRLVLENDDKKLKNSVMTFYRIRQKNLIKLEKKNKVLYKKE